MVELSPSVVAARYPAPPFRHLQAGHYQRRDQRQLHRLAQGAPATVDHRRLLGGDSRNRGRGAPLRLYPRQGNRSSPIRPCRRGKRTISGQAIPFCGWRSEMRLGALVVVLPLLVSACAGNHYYREKEGVVSFYFRQPEATEVLLVCSLDHFQPHPATRDRDGSWKVEIRAPHELPVFLSGRWRGRGRRNAGTAKPMISGRGIVCMSRVRLWPTARAGLQSGARRRTGQSKGVRRGDGMKRLGLLLCLLLVRRPRPWPARSRISARCLNPAVSGGNIPRASWSRSAWRGKTVCRWHR